MSTSKSFAAARPLKPHLMQETGGLAAEVNDVRKDVDAAFGIMEGRTGFPVARAIDGGAPAAAGGAMVVLGTNLLQGCLLDHAHLLQAAIDVEIKANKPGVSGYTFVMTTGGGGSSSAVFTPSTGVLAIALKTGGDTAANVAAAINTAGAGYLFATVVGGGSYTLAVTSTPLAGGTGVMAGFKVLVAGQEALPSIPWTDTSVTVTVPALTGLVATDIALIQMMAGGVQALSLAAALA